MVYHKNEPDHYEVWLLWAIEFAKRGLQLQASIDVHGPHAYPADLLWGDAIVSSLNEPIYTNLSIYFQTRKAELYRNYKNESLEGLGIRIYDDEGYGSRNNWPILKSSKMSTENKKWLKVLKTQLKGEIK